MMSRLVDSVARAIPARKQMLQLAARMPPAWRSSGSQRLCAALARRTLSANDTIVTNLGISTRVVCRVPGDRTGAAFGTPDLYAGERGALRTAAALSHHADGFLDVGAHLGYFTFYVNVHGPAGLPLVAVEPDPELFALLGANLVASGCERARAIQVAIGARDGESLFHRDLSDSFSGSLTTDFAAHDTVSIAVQVRTMAGLLDELGWTRACLKVDIEGAEAEFLEGAARSFDRVAFLIMEVLGPAHQRQFVAQMIRAGWQAYYLRDFAVVPSVDGAFDYLEPEYNWLFCRERPDALAALLPAPLAVAGARRA